MRLRDQLHSLPAPNVLTVGLVVLILANYFGTFADLDFAWHRTHVWWGDERAVPPDDPDSNYAMAEETLLSRVPIPPTQVHRMPADADA